MLLVEGSSETQLFTHLSKNFFWSSYFRKYISYEVHLFSEIARNFIYISKIQKKIEKNFFVLLIIASALAALICL